MGSIIKFLIIFLVVYYIGKFIIRIVIPVFTISQQIKKQRDMFMQQHQNAGYADYTGQTQDGVNYTQDVNQAPVENPQIAKRRFDDEDYIEYEEVN